MDGAPERDIGPDATEATPLPSMMIKRKFGDAVRSKTDVAIRNEVLAKVLCRNIAVVIHEMHELGIAPDFAPTPEARILRFPGS